MNSLSIKTHVARHIVRSLGLIPTVVILSQVSLAKSPTDFLKVALANLHACSKQDSFYKQHSEEDLKLAFANEYDFDHPDSIDMPLFASVRYIPA